MSTNKMSKQLQVVRTKSRYRYKLRNSRVRVCQCRVTRRIPIIRNAIRTVSPLCVMLIQRVPPLVIKIILAPATSRRDTINCRPFLARWLRTLRILAPRLAPKSIFATHLPAPRWLVTVTHWQLSVYLPIFPPPRRWIIPLSVARPGSYDENFHSPNARFIF